MDSTQIHRYIVNPHSTYKASFASMTYMDQNGIECVAYRNGQTLADYLAENPQCYALNSAQADEYLQKQFDSMVTEPEPCTAEHWQNMLEILPPCRWQTVRGVNMFHVSERLVGNIVSWFARIGESHYTFNDHADCEMESLAAKVAAVHQSQGVNV